MMFRTCSNNMNTGSFMNESYRAASFNSVRLAMDTVLAVSIFVILALVGSIIVLAELGAVILAVLSAVIIAAAVLLAVVIIVHKPVGRPNVVKA